MSRGSSQLQQPPQQQQPLMKHHGKALLWADLNQDHLDRLDKYLDKTDFDACKRFIADVCGLTDFDTNHRSQILLDLYYHTFSYANEHNFSHEKTSTFFSIIKHTHLTSMKQNFTMEQSVLFFRELLIQHSIQRPPFSVEIFSFEDVNTLYEYCLNTYYRHYRLYKYVFTQRHEMALTTFSEVCEQPIVVPPLAGALQTLHYASTADVPCEATDKKKLHGLMATILARELELIRQDVMGALNGQETKLLTRLTEIENSLDRVKA